MGTDICSDGPFTIEASILFLDDKGNEARVTYTLPPGRYPSADDIKAAIKVSTDTVALWDEGFRLANRKEFIRSHLGVDVAVPGPEEFV